MADDDGKRWTADAMYTLGMHHAKVETEGKIDETMATLIERPVYEFLPIGRRMVGADRVRRYYEHLVDDFMPRRIDVQMISETVSEAALAQEYVIDFEGPEGPVRGWVLGVLFADEARSGKLGGERIWGEASVLRQMVGPVWDELEEMD